MGVIRRFRSHDISRARAWHALQLADANDSEQRDTARFLLDCVTTPGPGRIVFGRLLTPSGWEWIGLPLDDAMGHQLYVGGSGGGKTAASTATVIQHRTYHPKIINVSIDKKSEYTDLFHRVILPALPSTAQILDRIHVIAPHGIEIDGQTYLPQLRITKPQPGVPHDLQALAITEALTAAIGDLGGARMDIGLLRLNHLAVELDRPLTVLRKWLEFPAVFAREAQRSKDPLLRAYGAQFPNEPAATRYALLSRISRILFERETQLCLSAPRCVDFSAVVREPGSVLSIQLFDTKAASSRSLAFWSPLLGTRLCAALLTRPITEDTPYVHVTSDEWHNELQRPEAHAFMKLSSLARFRRVQLVTIQQALNQLSQVDPSLPRIFRVNAQIEVSFRCAPEDASLLMPPSLDANANRAFARRLVNLSRREASLWIKRYSAHFIRTPRIDFDGLRRRAAAADPELRHAVLRGVDCERREVLEAHLAREEQESITVSPPTIPPVDENHSSPYPRLG